MALDLRGSRLWGGAGSRRGEYSRGWSVTFIARFRDRRRTSLGKFTVGTSGGPAPFSALGIACQLGSPVRDAFSP